MTTNSEGSANWEVLKPTGAFRSWRTKSMLHRPHLWSCRVWARETVMGISAAWAAQLAIPRRSEMKRNLTLVLCTVLAALAAPLSAAQDAPAKQAFDKMKGLAGTWKGTAGEM